VDSQAPGTVSGVQGATGEQGQRTTAAGEHERADGRAPAAGRRPVPATAVAPAAPVRHAPEGGFDFFGTKPPAAAHSSPSALDTVQNEDLADVVGEEALALHKADAEAGFKAVTDAGRGAGQVIDLTAHDETEPIDLPGLRNAVS
jgi:hypothetical protein